MKSSENLVHTPPSRKMAKYELIVAVNQDGIIGITDVSGNQRLAFNCREDMRFFRDTTMENILVMGRKTFESLPNSRPLPGRIHIVLSRAPRRYDERYTKTDDVFFSRLENLEEVLRPLVFPYSNKRVFICGGEEIYRALLPRCERLYITHVLSQIELNPGETTSQFHYLETEFEETESKESANQEFTDSGRGSKFEIFRSGSEGISNENGTCVFKTLERIKPSGNSPKI